MKTQDGTGRWKEKRSPLNTLDSSKSGTQSPTQISTPRNMPALGGNEISVLQSLWAEPIFQASVRIFPLDSVMWDAGYTESLRLNLQSLIPHVSS